MKHFKPDYKIPIYLFFIFTLFYLYYELSAEINSNTKIIKKYHDNGTLKTETKYYTDGTIETRHFFDNGKLQLDTYAKWSDKTIKLKSYNRQGVLLHESITESGKLIKHEFYCNEELRLIYAGNS